MSWPSKLLIWIVVAVAIWFVRHRDIGSPAPDFTLQGVYGGNDVHLDSFRGKSVLLVFWSTGCGICRHELPVIDKLYYAAARNNVDITCVNIGDIDGAREVMRPLRLRLNLVDPDGSAARSYGVSGVPKLVLLDPAGKIAWTVTGYQSESTLRRHLSLPPA